MRDARTLPISGSHTRAVSGCCAEFGPVSVGNIPVGCRIFPAVNASTDGGDGVNRRSWGASWRRLAF